MTPRPEQAAARPDAPRDRPAWHAFSAEELERRLETSRAGLAPEEARARLERFGPNQLAEAPRPSILAVWLHQFKSPLIYILLLATAVTFLLGEYIDAAVIAAVLLLNAIIGFSQEWKAEEAARALMQLLAPRARVTRAGREEEIESRELVPGDLVLLESGARVPADLRLVSVTALMIDESLLTGESLPVTKQEAPLDPHLALADRKNMVYAGTVVSRGRGAGYVVATGAETELGGIAEHMRREERAATPLQQRMNLLARLIGVVVLITVVFAFVLGVALGEPPAEMFMVGVALAVATVPEGLPVVFTITLALGVRRMARRNAIIRRLAAVETLGSTTTIGSDKTGTLTENRMTVQAIWTAGRVFDLEEAELPADGLAGASLVESSPLYLTLLAGVLSNEAEFYRAEEGHETRGDPTEAALLVAAARLGIEPMEARRAHRVLAEIPFEPELRYSASARQRDGENWLFVKGAPEQVAQMCSHLFTDEGPVPLDPETVTEAAHELAQRGLRVLGMAYLPLDRPPASAAEVPPLEGLTFLGLQGMLDPPRAGVQEAIDGCHAAGIRVVMITGDHADTARAIGERLGLVAPGAPVLTGLEMEALSDEQLRERVREVSIYARVAPEHKLRVVKALQAHRQVVAVTGDGANDAPALRAANIGIAMGKSGTDVAREAADMILADDNFVSIYAAAEEGRITFDNVRKVTFFLVSTGLAPVLVILAALVLGWPIPFLPAQLLWLNLVTKGLQDVALAFEPGEPDVLDRPPRSPDEGVISTLLWERTVVTGILMALGTLVLFDWQLQRTGDLTQAQTLALTTQVFFQMFHVANSRSEFQSLFRLNPFSNRFLFAAVVLSIAVHVGALYWGPTQFVLRVAPIEAAAWGLLIPVAATILLAVEGHKWLRRGLRPAARPAPRRV